MEKIKSGSAEIDKFLGGGYEIGSITTLFGPAATGKTTICILASIAVAKEGKKVIFVDTENGFSVERLKQLIDDYQKILDNLIFIRPKSFENQQKTIYGIKNTNLDVGLIIVDTISNLYRVELGRREDTYELNRQLGLSLMYLSSIARKNSIPILITSQVYDDPELKKTKVLGGNIIKKVCKSVIELEKLNNKRIMILREKDSLDEKKMIFKIIDKGIKEIEK